MAGYRGGTLCAKAGVRFGIPGGEDAQPLVGGRAGLGGEDHEALAAAVGAVPGVAVEGEVTDERVLVVLGAVAGAGDLMGGPPGAEVGVLHRQLADQDSELRVAGVFGGLHAQGRDDGARVVLPVGVQRAHSRVGEQQADVITVARGEAGEVGVQGSGPGVPGEDVQAAAEHDGGCLSELVEQAAHGRPGLLSRAPPGQRGLAGQLVEVCLLVVVQPQRAREGDEHRSGCLHAALLKPGEVVDADRGQLRDLLAAQARDLAVGAGLRQADLVRGQLGTAGLEEVAQPVCAAVAWVHTV
jgi:hypothetical protein